MGSLQKAGLEIRRSDHSPYRFLLVDDSEFVLKALNVVVRLLGGEVVGEARDGLEAVALYKKTHPDIVTCDVAMPNMNGVEAVRELVKLEPDANVIMVSAMSRPDIVRAAIDAGAKDFIVKPFRPIELARRLRNHLSKAFAE